jgi:23S rRNA pseudouridine2605 synthase
MAGTRRRPRLLRRSPTPGEVGRRADEIAERLQKVLAATGLGSRRHCDELVAQGRVTVNGRLARPGDRVDPEHDHVAVDGVRVPTAPGLVAYLVNKPRGVVTTLDDPQKRRTVATLVPSQPRVFPVGRLDADSEGLLVMTNDGQLAQALAHPSHGVAKEYLVEVEGTPGSGALRRLRRGVDLPDGRTSPATVGVLGSGLLRVIVHEGRNRMVRRMCEAVGHPVHRLVRTRIGPLRDDHLAPGEWRLLGTREVRALLEAAHRGGDRPRPSPRAHRAPPSRHVEVRR